MIIENIFLQIDQTTAATIVLAVSTVILVVVTGYHAITSRQSVAAINYAAELTIRPHLKASLAGLHPGHIILRITNAGNGPANNLRIRYDTVIIFERAPDNTPKKQTRISRNWSSAIMMPKDHEDFFLEEAEKKIQTSIDFFAKYDTTLMVGGTYQDVEDRNYTIEESIPVHDFAIEQKQVVQLFREESLKKIAHELEGIRTVMKDHASRRRWESDRPLTEAVKIFKKTQARKKPRKNKIRKKQKK